MTDPASDIDYSKLFQALPGRYLVMKADDPVFTIVEESVAHSQMAFVDRKKILGKPFFEVFPDTSDSFKETGVSDITKSFRRVMKSGQPDAMEVLKYDIKDADGVFRDHYWQATHYPLLDDTGEIAFIYQRSEDITDQIMSRHSLAQTQYQLDEALTVGQIGTWAWDVEKNIVIADKNLARMFGVSIASAAKGLELEVFTNSIYIDDRAVVLKNIEASVTAGAPYEQEYRTISTDGTIRWVIARGKTSTNSAGEVTSFAGVIVDITERKTAERNLSFLAGASSVLSSSLDYKSSLQNIATMAVPSIADWCSVELLDEKGDLQLLSVAHKNSQNIKWAQNYRMNNPHDTSDISHGIQKVLTTGKPEFYPKIDATTFSAQAKNNSDAKLIDKLQISSLIMVPLHIQKRVVGVLTLVSTDQKYFYIQSDLEMAIDLARRASLAMTNAHLFEDAHQQLIERERLQVKLTAANEALETRVKRRTAQLEATNLNLERSNQELQDFAYVASHDLQEPLRKIQAFGTILEEEYGKELGEGQDYLNRMRGAAARMSTLIEDLLAFSRVTTHAKDQKVIDLNVIAAEVIEDLETRINDTKGKVIIGELPSIKADPMQMRQLFQNLIGNALKFHKPNVPPVVELVSEIIQTKNKSSCILRIVDNGVGFDEKYLDRIFSVFQRLHGRDQYEGTGIGLAVCRKIVERHGGTITATSIIGKGATFIITLPISNKDKEHSA